MPPQATGRQAELEAELAAFNWRDYVWTAAACAVSIPLGARAGHARRFLPLGTLGTAGGLADWFAAEARLKGPRDELVALLAAQKEAAARGDGERLA
jgi:hypothetical protein